MIVVDTNVLISALIKGSVTRRVIVESNLELMYPEHLLKEVEKYEGYILKKNKYCYQSLCDQCPYVRH